MIDKNYFLSRLNAGDNIDEIGQEIADMMNAAIEEHAAQEALAKEAAAKAENEAAKRDIIKEMCELVQEYAILEGIEPKNLAVSEDEITKMAEAFTGMFAVMRDLEALVSQATPSPKATPAKKSDDQILSDFCKLFS